MRSGNAGGVCWSGDTVTTSGASRPATFAVLFVAVTLVLLAGTAAGFFGTGPWAWSVGVVYIVYDTWLLSHMVLSSRRSIREAAAAREAAAGAPAPSADPRPSVAVVIAARDERAVLTATLERLLGQDDAPDRVLLVDDGSADVPAPAAARRGARLGGVPPRAVRLGAAAGGGGRAQLARWARAHRLRAGLR